jgi:hypothetical protein
MGVKASLKKPIHIAYIKQKESIKILLFHVVRDVQTVIENIWICFA